MNYRGFWMALPVAIACIVGTSALPALAQRAVSTPLSGRQEYSASSNSQRARCEDRNTQAEVVSLTVTEILANLTFTISGSAGQPTLRVVNDRTGRETCVMADNLSGSQVELSAAWEADTYSVYVGDHNGERHNYTLTVQQN